MRSILVAVALIGVGALGLFWIFGPHESVRDYLDSSCRHTGITTDPNGNRARRYDCPKPLREMAEALRKAHKPADQRTTTSGTFLRYSNDMVGITAGESPSRSTAYLADERSGYAFFFPYVGGFWGTYRGPAESFRGGGPAGGK